MVTKLGQFKMVKCRERSQLCKLSQLCYHFLSSFENENYFFFYNPSNPPPIAFIYIGISILVIPDHMLI